MTTTRKLGIWMDHASANIMEFKVDHIDTKIIKLGFTHEEKENSLAKSEGLLHSKEQQRLADYYKQLGAVIKNYEEVILFGPTDAKVELFNVLLKDHGFSKIKIELKQADKMTENQQHAFVREYFSK